MYIKLYIIVLEKDPCYNISCAQLNLQTLKLLLILLIILDHMILLENQKLWWHQDISAIPAKVLGVVLCVKCFLLIVI